MPKKNLDATFTFGDIISKSWHPPDPPEGKETFFETPRYVPPPEGMLIEVISIKEDGTSHRELRRNGVVVPYPPIREADAELTSRIEEILKDVGEVQISSPTQVRASTFRRVAARINAETQCRAWTLGTDQHHELPCRERAIFVVFQHHVAVVRWDGTASHFVTHGLDPCVA